MKKEVLFPSKYLNAGDFAEKDYMLTVRAVTADEVVMKGGKKDMKGVVRFEGADKMLILNKGHWDGIDSENGGDDETDNWIGKEVILTSVLYFDKAKKEWLPCIRIRRASDQKVYYAEYNNGLWFDCPRLGKPVGAKVKEVK